MRSEQLRRVLRVPVRTLRGGCEETEKATGARREKECTNGAAPSRYGRGWERRGRARLGRRRVQLHVRRLVRRGGGRPRDGLPRLAPRSRVTQRGRILRQPGEGVRHVEAPTSHRHLVRATVRAAHVPDGVCFFTADVAVPRDVSTRGPRAVRRTRTAPRHRRAAGRVRKAEGGGSSVPRLPPD